MASALMLGRVVRAVPLRVAPLATQARWQRRHISYKAPRRDVEFILDEVLDVKKHYAKIGQAEAVDLIPEVIDNFAKFSENVLGPLNVAGDQVGCKHDKKTANVSTPTGFKAAYDEYAAGGWQGMTVPEAYGGMGLPLSLGLVKSEMVGTANWSWGMFPGLSVGCMNTLILHASEQQKQDYLTKLADGSYLGTMCLTEPQCGTDLNQVKTRAVRQEDGSFKITGTKIFISCGEHDWGENIVHIVLARIDGAPAGIKGISLFLVPKFLPKADGQLDTKKNVECGGLESKMGIHGSPTCIMNFEDSTGYLIGQENSGLRQMFTFMNTARIGTALQGIGAAELAYQGALPYAEERKSLRALSGVKAPDDVADPLIHHGDVRRMLLTCKAVAEGGRCMMYHTAMLSDGMLADAGEDAKKLDDDLGLLTPILKGFLTEMGCEAASLGMQVWGGHGYIQGNGMEQVYRDARIGTLYEGTTGIQALDLLGRKILLSNGRAYRQLVGTILGYCKQQIWDKRNSSAHKREAARLAKYTAQWAAVTAGTGLQARSNKDTVGTASYDYLMYSGYTVMGYYWLRMMDVAEAKLQTARTPADIDYYKSKIKTGKFYFEKMLPRADGHMGALRGKTSSVMNMSSSEFHASYQ